MIPLLPYVLLHCRTSQGYFLLLWYSEASGSDAFGGPALIVVIDGVRKRRVKAKSNGSYQEVEVQFVSGKMIFWKRTMSAVSRRSGRTSEGWHAGRRRSRL